jgi:DNA repair protein RecO (recombination protein O)
MEWNDDGIVLAARRHGERAIILEALARSQGRHLGLVHGGASRQLKSVLLPGNTLSLAWRARLAEHLGTFAVELRRERAGAFLDRREALIGLNAFTSVVRAALPEREPHESVYLASEILLEAVETEDFSHWGPLFVRWEAGVLEALGFGLDLSRCASTGATADLCYVSPKSGRAVSREAGAPYRERLFELPGFLLASQGVTASMAEISAGLRLTGHFLLERVLLPHERQMPAARSRLQSHAGRESA